MERQRLKQRQPVRRLRRRANSLIVMRVWSREEGAKKIDQKTSASKKLERRRSQKTTLNYLNAVASSTADKPSEEETKIQ